MVTSEARPNAGLTRDPRCARRYCPRCSVGYKLCRCGLRPGRAVVGLWHFAPRALRQTVLNDGLVPQPVAVCDWGPQVSRQPPGVYVFADRFTAERERSFLTAVKGPLDLWRVDAADVSELHVDHGFAGESYYLSQPARATKV